MPDITLDDGMKALEAAFAKARSLNVIVGVSVVDARGDLVASARMDDSLWWWTESSRAKAMATVTYGGIPSGELTERAARPVAQTLLHMHQGLGPSRERCPLRRVVSWWEPSEPPVGPARKTRIYPLSEHPQ